MKTTPEPAEQPFAGLRVLVVEDMFLIADDLADRLSGWGCEVVGPEGHVEGALRQIASSKIDGALLDVNLDGETSFEIARLLLAKNVPFIFLTGYDSDMRFPAELQSAPKLTKPLIVEALRTSLRQYFF